MEPDAFRDAGRTLFSLGLVRGTEGNLSTFDGTALVITKTGRALGDLARGDLVAGSLDGPVEGASSDLEVHREEYRRRGPGAIAHAHPPGSVPEAESPRPGGHGIYVFASTLREAADRAVAMSRARAR